MFFVPNAGKFQGYAGSRFRVGVLKQHAIVRLCLLIFLLSVLHSLTALAQTGPDVLDVRPYAPHSGSSFESVSAANGSLNLSIPVWSFQQRGPLKLDFMLRYDVPSYVLEYECDAGSPPTGPQSAPVGTPAFLPPAGSCTYPHCDNYVDEYCLVDWTLGSNTNAVPFPFVNFDGVRILSSTDYSYHPLC